MAKQPIAALQSLRSCGHGRRQNAPQLNSSRAIGLKSVHQAIAAKHIDCICMVVAVSNSPEGSTATQGLTPQVLFHAALSTMLQGGCQAVCKQ